MPLGKALSNKAALNKASAVLGRIENELLNSGKLVKWAGPEVKKLVGGQVTKGNDANDTAFVPYSDNYAKTKKGGRHSPVTLDDTGTMLGLLDFNATGGASGKVYVRAGGSPNRAAVAAAHHHGQGVPQREWLGVSPSSMKVLNRKTLIYAESALALMNAGEGGFVKQGPKAFTKKGATVWVNTGHAK